MTEQCGPQPDGSRLDFGGDVIISGTYPEMQISVSSGDFTADLRLRGTQQAAWFARTPF